MEIFTQTLSRDKILGHLETHRLDIQSFGVERLGLFGSFIKGEQNAESDIDFLVKYKTGHKNLKNYFGLMDWLENAFQREIELVTIESLSPYLAPHIENEVKYVSLTS